MLFEVNQPWDSNDFWTNDKFPDDFNYKTSLQPALVYEVIIPAENSNTEYLLKPIGHSHPSGETGGLFTDLSTTSTALEIFSKVAVTIE